MKASELMLALYKATEAHGDFEVIIPAEATLLNGERLDLFRSKDRLWGVIQTKRDSLHAAEVQTGLVKHLGTFSK